MNNIKEETERQIKKDRLILCLLGVTAMLMTCGVIAAVVLS